MTFKPLKAIAAGLCIIAIGAGHKTSNMPTNQEAVSFQDDYFNRNILYTCLSHGEFCTDGEGIYSIYGDPDDPAS